jgi:two-component system, OmpR family, response regulator VicR
MKKILVAEDDKYLNTAYRLKLTKAGFEVRLASDGEEALEILNEFTPDLMLLDLMMPKKDGFAALEEIKKNENWRNIPVIVASNLGQEGDIQRAMKLGAADFVIKSDMSMEGLLKKIVGYVGAAS